jgi:ketosteroid isomerase-like protein
MEEARRDAGVTDRDVDVIREVNRAVAARDLGAVAERMHPDIVWEHNLGAGSLEEGTYTGRENVLSLLERILEPWEQMRSEIVEIRDLGEGRYDIRGQLHAKHSTSASEVVSPYIQHFEFDEGLLVKGQMKTLGDLESDQVAAVRRFTEAFNRRDFDALIADTGPETELHEWPEAPGAQSYRGPDELQRAFDNWFESWEWMQVEIEEVEEAGDQVMATLHQRARGRGSQVEVEIRSFNVWSFKDGVVSEIRLFTDRESALAAFGTTKT